MSRFQILAPHDGKMAVMLTDLSRSDAIELVASFGSRAIMQPVGA